MQKMLFPVLILILALSLGLVGCGGGSVNQTPNNSTPPPGLTPVPSSTLTPITITTPSPTPSPTPTPVPAPITLKSMPSQDGFITLNKEGAWYNIDKTSSTLSVGGFNVGITHLKTCGYFTFETTDLPSANIQSAKLRLYYEGVKAHLNAFNTMGSLLLRNVRMSFLQGGGYSYSYRSGYLDTQLKPASNSVANIWIELDVTNWVKNDCIGNRLYTQYELEFQDALSISDDWSGEGYAIFSTGEDSTNPPQLVITFQ